MYEDIQKIEASLFTRIIYLFGLGLIILTFLAKVPFALRLLSQIGRNQNLVNPILAVVLIITAIVVVVTLGKRFLDIARGKLKLSAVISSKKTLYIRRIGLTLLSIGVSITLLVFISAFFIRGGGQMMIAAYFSFAIPLGLVLFELSRMKEFENLNLANDV